VGIGFAKIGYKASDIDCLLVVGDNIEAKKIDNLGKFIKTKLVENNIVPHGVSVRAESEAIRFALNPSKARGIYSNSPSIILKDDGFFSELKKNVGEKVGHLRTDSVLTWKMSSEFKVREGLEKESALYSLAVVRFDGIKFRKKILPPPVSRAGKLLVKAGFRTAKILHNTGKFAHDYIGSLTGFGPGGVRRKKRLR
jgi:hypothetical protein